MKGRPCSPWNGLTETIHLVNGHGRLMYGIIQFTTLLLRPPHCLPVWLQDQARILDLLAPGKSATVKNIVYHPSPIGKCVQMAALIWGPPPLRTVSNKCHIVECTHNDHLTTSLTLQELSPARRDTSR